MIKPDSASDNAITYASSGVDIDVGNEIVDRIRPIVQTTARPGANAHIGGFAGVFDLAKTRFTDPLLIASTDGVGTKVKIAIENNQHYTIGIDLVAMCVNDLVVQGAEPLFFLDYYAAGKLDVDACSSVVQGIAEGCRESGCALIGGETAEMPGVYGGKDYDLAGFAVGAVERHSLLPQNHILPGDVILALASSGIHANGFSLVRYIAQKTGIKWTDPAPFTDTTLGQALLTPTRIYVRPLLETLRSCSGIKAAAHITGGGIVENVPRAVPQNLTAVIDLTCIRMPPVFPWLAATGTLTQAEMLRTFNCGVGMALIVAEEHVPSVMASLAFHGEQVYHIGVIAPRHEDRVSFTGKLPT